MRVAERKHGLRAKADFNGLFGNLLCLSHDDTCVDEFGNVIALRQGMILTAFEEELDDDGVRDDLIASGRVEPSPKELQCLGSRWVLVIDENGVCHDSDLGKKPG